MSHAPKRRGFALPAVILVLFVLVGALGAGFAMLRTETAIDDAAIQNQAAAALAESGLEQGLRNRTTLGLSAVPPAAGDSTRVTLSGGYADIITSQVRAPVGAVPGLYLVRARGVRTTSGTADGGNAIAMSTSFATFAQMEMTVQSAMTGINGISKAGAAGALSGADGCPAGSGGGAASVAGVAVPTTPGYSQSGGSSVPSGSPNISTMGANATAAAAAVPIDWSGIVYDDAITPTHNLPGTGAGFPSQTWFDNNPNVWPVIIVRNGPYPETEYELTVDGRGTLIIFGDVRLNGNGAGWSGVILVGGRMRSNGGNSVDGTIITGLNVKLGYSVSASDVNDLNGTKSFQYNSCNIRNSLQALGSLRVYRNTWANSYPAY